MKVGNLSLTRVSFMRKLNFILQKEPNLLQMLRSKILGVYCLNPNLNFVSFSCSMAKRELFPKWWEIEIM